MKLKGLSGLRRRGGGYLRSHGPSLPPTVRTYWATFTRDELVAIATYLDDSLDPDAASAARWARDVLDDFK